MIQSTSYLNDAANRLGSTYNDIISSTYAANRFIETKLTFSDKVCAFAVGIIASLGALFSKTARTIASEAWIQLFSGTRVISTSSRHEDTGAPEEAATEEAAHEDTGAPEEAATEETMAQRAATEETMAQRAATEETTAQRAATEETGAAVRHDEVVGEAQAPSVVSSVINATAWFFNRIRTNELALTALIYVASGLLLGAQNRQSEAN